MAKEKREMLIDIYDGHWKPTHIFPNYYMLQVLKEILEERKPLCIKMEFL